jgi:hypothetical protein
MSNRDRLNAVGSDACGAPFASTCDPTRDLDSGSAFWRRTPRRSLAHRRSRATPPTAGICRLQVRSFERDRARTPAETACEEQAARAADPPGRIRSPIARLRGTGSRRGARGRRFALPHDITGGATKGRLASGVVRGGAGCVRSAPTKATVSPASAGPDRAACHVAAEADTRDRLLAQVAASGVQGIVQAHAHREIVRPCRASTEAGRLDPQPPRFSPIRPPCLSAVLTPGECFTSDQRSPPPARASRAPRPAASDAASSAARRGRKPNHLRLGADRAQALGSRVVTRHVGFPRSRGNSSQLRGAPRGRRSGALRSTTSAGLPGANRKPARASPQERLGVGPIFRRGRRYGIAAQARRDAFSYSRRVGARHCGTL